MFDRIRESAAPRKMLALVTALTTALGPSVAPAFAASPQQPWKTPIKHIVVIFNENISFDHYFGTYPVALNPKGEPHFHATGMNLKIIQAESTGGLTAADIPVAIEEA